MLSKEESDKLRR